MIFPPSHVSRERAAGNRDEFIRERSERADSNGKRKRRADRRRPRACSLANKGRIGYFFRERSRVSRDRDAPRLSSRAEARLRGSRWCLHRSYRCFVSFSLEKQTLRFSLKLTALRINSFLELFGRVRVQCIVRRKKNFYRDYKYRKESTNDDNVRLS